MSETKEIQVGSIVTRKGGGGRGTVEKVYLRCSCPLSRHHSLAAINACTYKLRPYAYVRWRAYCYRLNGSQGNLKAAPYPFSRLTLVEDPDANR